MEEKYKQSLKQNGRFEWLFFAFVGKCVCIGAIVNKVLFLSLCGSGISLCESLILKSLSLVSKFCFSAVEEILGNYTQIC